LTAAARGYFKDESLVDEQQRVVVGSGRSQQPCGSKSQHRNVLIAAKKTTMTKIVAVFADMPGRRSGRVAECYTS